MSVLFFQPLVGEVTEDGDKLYFYLTNTTTDVTVYQDGALTTPHTQPVVADSSGRFAPIYIDPTDGDLKVVQDTSADVERYTVDPYPVDDLATLTGDVSTNTTDIAGLGGRVTTAESEIDTLQAESIDYESRISTNETDITALQADSLTAFPATLAIPGTIALPTDSGGNDWIIKIEKISVPADDEATLTWDTPFPNQCLIVFTTINGNVDDQNDASANAYDETATQVTIQNTVGSTKTIAVAGIGF